MQILILLSILAGMAFPAVVLLNSQDYRDVISTAAYARHNNYSFVFALTPNQSVFISKYYTSAKNDPVIYLEGKVSVLPNMAALLRSSGVQNLTLASPPSIQSWIADQSSKDEAIVVGSQYGQDALSVSAYAAAKGAPIFFIDDASDSGGVVGEVASRGYGRVIVYGSIAHQVDPQKLALISGAKIIDTGNRYENNLEIAREFLAFQKSRQAIFVSGYTFEKSMADGTFPVFLVGRSDINPSLPAFLRENNITSGIVFSGDSSIVDAVDKLRQTNPELAFFVKFGEGYRGSSQPMPLMVIPLPSPNISLEVINLTYNIPSKAFELQLANRGDFAAVAAGASVQNTGSAESSQIFMDPGSSTTLAIPLDATGAIAGIQIPQVIVSVRYGEDAALMDNIDTISFTNVPTSQYADTSDVRLSAVSYLSAEKSFVLAFEGKGWVEGTVGFNINNRPIVIRVPLSQIDGNTQVKIKYYLSDSEEKYTDTLGSLYFLRSGQRQDLLMKEAKGQSQITLIAEKKAPFNLPDLGVPIPCIFGFIVIAVLAYFGYRQFGHMSGGGFD